MTNSEILSMMEKEELIKSFQKGQQDFKDGKKIGDNPYWGIPLFWKSWENGWKQEQEKSEQH